MTHKRKIALVAHDNRKADLIDWVKWNQKKLLKHNLVCTGTTGKMVKEALKIKGAKAKKITMLKSGPLGGDLQLGALITERKIDILIFFWDPMQPQPHDVDVKALLRIAVVYNVPFACNRSSADYFITSDLVEEDYQPAIKDYSAYLNREVK